MVLGFFVHHKRMFSLTMCVYLNRILLFKQLLSVFLGTPYNVWSRFIFIPKVGDIRIQFSYSGKDGDLFTVVGKQAGREIREEGVK